MSRKEVNAIILKERTAPVLLEGLEAAISRLPHHHPALPKIQARYASTKAGFGGEQELDRVLRNYEFPDNTHILNDVSLSSRTFFQMDTLILTPEFALICEVKNISGELSIIENPPQLLRVADDGTTSGFLSPIAQVANTCQLFEDWLITRDVALPVLGCVVLAYPKQRIALPKSEIPVLFPSAVPRYVRSLSTKASKLTETELVELTNTILKTHVNYIPPPICTNFQITPMSIKPGVACPGCERLGMWKRGKGWYCPACKARSEDAHIQAIRDWFLLFGEPLTNKSCRTFLGISNPQTALRVITSMNLTPQGNNRGRTYTLQLGKSVSKHT